MTARGLARRCRGSHGLLVFAAAHGDVPGENRSGRSVVIATTGYRFAATAGIALVAGLAVALPARAQSLEDFYAKAKGEGAFAFYVGGPTAPWEARAKVFEERYPGIKVTIGGGFSNVLDKKVDAQLAAGKLEVDAVIIPNRRRLRALESRRPAAGIQTRRLRQNGCGVQGFRRHLLGHHGERGALHVQHREGRSRRHPEFGAGFPETAVPGQDRYCLSGRRR